MKEENTTLDQTAALNKLLLQLIESKRHETKMLWTVCVGCLIAMVITIISAFWFVSNMEVTTTTTTEETITTTYDDDTITQDGGEGNGTNIYQGGDGAIYNAAPSNGGGN